MGGIGEMVYRTRGTHVPGGSKRIEEEAPQDPHRAAWRSDVDVVLYGFRVGGLEAI